MKTVPNWSTRLTQRAKPSLLAPAIVLATALSAALAIYCQWLFFLSTFRPGSDLSLDEAAVELSRFGQLERDETRPDRPIFDVTLRGRRVTDGTMNLVARLKSIRSLRLDDTRVSDAGLRQIVALGELRWLYLDGTLITDEGVQSLVQLTSIEGLSLRDTLITEKGIARLKEMKGLQWLGLFDTGVGDATLIALREVPQIRRLTVKLPAFTDDGVARFRGTNPGTQIVWSRCAVLPDPFLDELSRRRIRRQGWTGRIRLAWKALIGWS
jgi:hypothetical protein